MLSMASQPAKFNAHTCVLYSIKSAYHSLSMCLYITNYSDYVCITMAANNYIMCKLWQWQTKELLYDTFIETKKSFFFKAC